MSSRSSRPPPRSRLPQRASWLLRSIPAGGLARCAPRARLALITVALMAVIRQLARTSAAVARTRWSLHVWTAFRPEATISRTRSRPSKVPQSSSRRIFEEGTGRSARRSSVSCGANPAARGKRSMLPAPRAGRATARKIELNGMVREVLALEGLAAGKRNLLHAELAEASLPAAPTAGCSRNALQNLIRQRLRGDCGNRKYQRAHWFPQTIGAPGVVVSVEDTASGWMRAPVTCIRRFFTRSQPAAVSAFPSCAGSWKRTAGRVDCEPAGTWYLVRIRLPIG